MKKFDPDIIRNYISAHKSEICCVIVGYNEVWFWSSKVVFCNGNYVRNLDNLNERIPNGTKRTPYMKVIYNDGMISFLYAFKPEA